ncbi:MAG: TolC family protein [Desulfuromonadaceae bacterium]
MNLKSLVLCKRVVLPVVGIVSLLLTTPTWGAEKAINLPDAISAALINYGELKALRSERGMSEAAAVKAALYPNPVLELGGASGALAGSSSENNFFLGISQEFLTGGKREKRLQVAEKELFGFDNRISDAERLLRLEVTSVYYHLLLAHSRLGLAQRAEELNISLLRIAGERLAAGEVAELDVNLARVEAARAEGKKIDAATETAPVQQRLLLLMGSPPGDTVNVSGSLDAGGSAGELVELKKQALENRHDLKVLKSEIEKAEAEVLLAKADRLPNVTVGAGYTREHTLTSLGGMEEKGANNLFGLKVSFPLPLFDRNQAGQQQASARRNSTESRYLFALQSIERDVEAAHARLSSAQKAVALYRTGILPQLEENLKLVQEAYQSGEVGILAVIEEQKKFIDVNDSYLTALYNRNSAAATLEAAVGVELKTDNGGNQ